MAVFHFFSCLVVLVHLVHLVLLVVVFIFFHFFPPVRSPATDCVWGKMYSENGSKRNI